jgi:hypothetical protein
MACSGILIFSIEFSFFRSYLCYSSDSFLSLLTSDVKLIYPVFELSTGYIDS